MPEGVLTLGYQFFRKSLFRTLIPMPDCQMTGEAMTLLWCVRFSMLCHLATEHLFF